MEVKIDTNYISVIIPVYNSERYLRKCIDSIINQTLKEIEIILINDGSTDNSFEIMEKYRQKDERIIVINTNNGGVSSARNKGIEIANGDYIIFIDSDDWCDYEMLEEMYNFAKKNKLDFVGCGYIMETINGRCIRSIITNQKVIGKKNKDISNILYRLELGYSVGKLYKRSILNDNNIRFNENINFAEDAIFIQEYILNIDSIGELGKGYYHYVRVNNQSLSTKYVDNMSFIMEKYWDISEKVYNKFTLYGDLMRESGKIKEIDGVILSLYNNYKINCYKNRKQRIEEIKILLENKKIRKLINNLKPVRKNQKILKVLWKINNPYFIDFVCRIKPVIEKLIYKWSDII